MRLGMHSNRGPYGLTHGLMGLGLLLATACGGELPPEDLGDVSSQASSLASCSPDVTPPVALCQPEAGFRECSAYGYLIEETDLSMLRDDCGIYYVSREPVLMGGPGVYSTGVSASDGAHHSASCSSKWTVGDTFPPSLTLNGQVQRVLSLGAPYYEEGAYGSDSCEGGPLDHRIQSSGWVYNWTPGVYPVTYSLSDGSGHTTRRSRLVTVLPEDPNSCTEQLAAPVIVLQGSTEERLECGREPWNDPGAMAADACGGVTVHSYNSGKDGYGPGPNWNAEGSYPVQYLAWNGQGTTSVQRTVSVQDTTPPMLRLKGDMRMTHTCGSPWVDPGYTATDACYGDVAYSVQVTGSVNGWAAGTYTLTYEARDPGGRRSNIQRRTVDVVNCPW